MIAMIGRLSDDSSTEWIDVRDLFINQLDVPGSIRNTPVLMGANLL